MRIVYCCVMLSLVTLNAWASEEFAREEIEQAKKVEMARREKLPNKGRKNYRLAHAEALLNGAVSTIEKSEPLTQFDYTRLKSKLHEALEEVERVKRLTARAQSELPPLP